MSQEIETEVKKVELSATVYHDDPLRLRSELASATVDGHDIEISQCMSGGHFYFRSEGKQVGVNLADLTHAVLPLLGIKQK